MIGLRRTLPILAFVTACGGSASTVADAPPSSISPPAPVATNDPDVGSPPDAEHDAAIDAPHLDGSTGPDAALDAGTDAEPVDAGFCGKYSVAFTEWSVTAAQGLYIKGGTCIPTTTGDVPDCVHAMPCGCMNVNTTSVTPTPVFYASNAGGVIRTPFDTSVISGYTCP